jgi:crotonobetaine/carnitine-CoA ligase
MTNDRDLHSIRVVGDLLRTRASTRPDGELFRCGDAGWRTNAEVDGVADRIASSLASREVAKGDRVAVLSPNREEVLELLFGCARLGAVQVALNPYLKGEFLRHQLADSGASVLITDREGLRASESLLAQTSVKHVILLDPEDGALEDPGEFTSYADFLAAGEESFVGPEIGPADLIAIVYTSGTTGMPKGCMLSHGYYTHAPRLFHSVGLVDPGERLFTALPLFHAGGQMFVLMGALMNHAAAHFEAQFSASAFMRRAREAGATSLWGPGSMGMMILAQPETYADASYSFKFANWSPMHADRQAEFERRFNCPIYAGMFGQTECIAIMMSPFGGGHRRSSGGQPVPQLEVGIVDEADRHVPTGGVGEIVLRPKEPHVMFDGYWRNPEATLAAWRNLWHHTGDNGQANADGVITFVDRKKDALRRRGENVSSFELELAIAQHASVAQVAVCAVPSQLGEDEIKACIVCHPGSEPDPAELFSFLKSELPYFAIPRYVEFRVGLPVNPTTGRVVKDTLRKEGIPPAAIDFDALGLVVSRDERRA